MMDSALQETLEELRLTGKRALAFDNFVMRRAWGVYYAIWALAIALFIFIPSAIYALVPPEFMGIVFPVVYILIGISATLGVTRTFSLAEGTINLRRSLYGKEHDTKRNVYIYLTGWSILIALMVVISVNFQTPVGFILISTFLSAIDIYVYFTLRRYFLRIPAEGLMAVGAFAFSTVGGLAAAALTQSSTVYDIFWLPTIATWVFAALYTLYRAPEDLVMSN